MLGAATKQDSALDASEETTEPIARWESGCHPPQVEIGIGIRCTVVSHVCKTLAHPENFAVHATTRMPNGFWTYFPIFMLMSKTRKTFSVFDRVPDSC